MINFAKDQDGLVLKYSMGYGGDWIRKELKAQGSVTISRVFTFIRSKETYLRAQAKTGILKISNIGSGSQNGSRRIIASRVVYLSYQSDVLIAINDIKVERKIFVAERNISIFRHLRSATKILRSTLMSLIAMAHISSKYQIHDP